MVNGVFALKTMTRYSDVPEIWRNLPLHKRLEFAARQKIPRLQELKPHGGKCAIVGTAPSVRKFLREIRRFDGYDMIMPINTAHDYLISNGILPRIQVLMEPDISEIEYSIGGLPHQDVYYYVCSQCEKATFRQLKNHKKVLWHTFHESEKYQNCFLKLFPNEFLVGGQATTLLKAINIASILGFRHFELFGCDCSFEGENIYVNQHAPNNDERLDVTIQRPNKNERIGERCHIVTKAFKTTPMLSLTADEIIRICEDGRGIKFKVHGDGLLRSLHERKYPDAY